MDRTIVLIDYNNRTCVLGYHLPACYVGCKLAPTVLCSDVSMAPYHYSDTMPVIMCIITGNQEHRMIANSMNQYRLYDDNEHRHSKPALDMVIAQPASQQKHRETRNSGTGVGEGAVIPRRFAVGCALLC